MTKEAESKHTADDGTASGESLGPKEEKPSSAQDEEKTSRCSFSCFLRCLNNNQFPLLILLAIILAKACPRGGGLLQAEITATWIAVIVIFLISGLCLRWGELSNAFQRLYFNAFVQVFNFGVVSITVFGFSRLVEAMGAINSALSDGLVICSCLPVRDFASSSLYTLSQRYRKL